MLKDRMSFVHKYQIEVDFLKLPNLSVVTMRISIVSWSINTKIGNNSEYSANLLLAFSFVNINDLYTFILY